MITSDMQKDINWTTPASRSSVTLTSRNILVQDDIDILRELELSDLVAMTSVDFTCPLDCRKGNQLLRDVSAPVFMSNLNIVPTELKFSDVDFLSLPPEKSLSSSGLPGAQKSLGNPLFFPDVPVPSFQPNDAPQNAMWGLANDAINIISNLGNFGPVESDNALLDHSNPLTNASSDVETVGNFPLMNSRHFEGNEEASSRPVEPSARSLLKKTKRKRVDLKPRSKGNNRYGQKGNLRCGQCRKRNSKCIYEEKWKPCLFCRCRNIKDPCIKLPGPKAVARLEPSRLLPTAMDAVIDSEDALLLQFIYCNAKRLENRFYLLITALASNYGLSISHPTLRHAAIALAAADLSERRFKEKSKEHQQKTFSALRSMLASPHLLCELDLFAAIVLGTLAVWENNPAEVLVHSRGCLAILSHFCRNSIESRASNALRVFRPFFIDALDRLLRFTNDLDLIQLTLAIRVKFSQRVEYYQVLYPREAVYMAASMICKRTLYDFIAAVRSAINVTAVGKLVDKNAFVQLLNRAKAELNDPEFRQALDLHYERQKTHQYQDPQYVEQYLNCIHMLMVLLEAPTIWQGRHDPIAKSLAIKIISYYRSLQLPRGRVTNTIGVWHLYIEFLMRGGFVLHPKATPELCTWLTKELAHWGYENEAKNLQTFWKSACVEDAKRVWDFLVSFDYSGY